MTRGESAQAMKQRGEEVKGRGVRSGTNRQVGSESAELAERVRKRLLKRGLALCESADWEHAAQGTEQSAAAN